MDTLKLKIPPLLLVIIVAALMWLVSVSSPTIELPLAFRVAAWSLLTLVGTLIAITGVIGFKQANTTLNPTSPDSSSSLVRSGIYQYTRNPMYVGFVLLLIGWGVFLANIYALVLPIGFVLYLNKFQIQPEEDALVERFGEQMLSYKKQVRRWL